MSSNTRIKLPTEDEMLRSPAFRGGAGMRPTASAALVNRTHRVVHERARNLQARRSKMRSLSIPLAVSACMLVALAVAMWTAFEGYEVSPTALPGMSQALVLMGWSLPITGMVLAVVWFRRLNARTDDERAK